MVEVRYDPKALPFERLLLHAQRTGCDRAVFTTTAAQQRHAAAEVGRLAQRAAGRIRPDREPKYYLFKHPSLSRVPMTELQAIRVNVAVGRREGDAAVRALLSPRQQALWAAVQAAPDAGWPRAVGQDLVVAWARADAVRHKAR